MEDNKHGECCKCQHCKKTKERSPEEFRSLMNRIKRIQGQLRGIEKMLDSNAYCTDILTQSAAARAALDSFNRELLSSHIKSCVAQNIREGNDDVVDELLDTLRRLMK